MTPQEVVRIRQGMGWTQTEAAARIGVAANTWARWEQGTVKPHHLRERDLRRLLHLADRRAAKQALLESWG